MENGEAVEKVEIINHLKLLRDSPTEEIYEELREQLLEMSEDLLVKPGNTKNFVSFHQYFDKNWHSCREMWVFCHRRNHPTEGVNDTQSAESSFRAIKHYHPCAGFLKIRHI